MACRADSVALRTDLLLGEGNTKPMRQIHLPMRLMLADIKESPLRLQRGTYTLGLKISAEVDLVLFLVSSKTLLAILCTSSQD